jgi:hypothetical protein
MLCIRPSGQIIGVTLILLDDSLNIKDDPLNNICEIIVKVLKVDGI